jgi:hypothetical protein
MSTQRWKELGKEERKMAKKLQLQGSEKTTGEMKKVFQTESREK